jgi:hypothetical protein
MGRTCVLGAVLLLSLVCSRSASAGETSDSFLPGEMATPLGLSSTVADFDADGHPDIARAESLQIHGGGQYRLNIQLSGGSAQPVMFVSGQGAVDVTAVDVDNDRDLDVVVRPILSNDIVGVWLNDGAGRFTREFSAVPIPPRTTLQASALTSGVPHSVLGDLSRGRISHPMPLGPTLVVADSSRLVLPESLARLTTACSCVSRPRAPPVPPLLSVA